MRDAFDSRSPVSDLELERAQVVARPLAETFAFFSDPWNLAAITPASLRFQIVAAPEELVRGSLLRYRLRLFGVPISWRTEIADWRPPRTFTDRQLAGPYRLWVHTHRFSRVSGGTEIYDNVRYRLPAGRLSAAPHRLLVRGWLDAIFDFRRDRLAALLG